MAIAFLRLGYYWHFALLDQQGSLYAPSVGQPKSLFAECPYRRLGTAANEQEAHVGHSLLLADSSPMLLATPGQKRTDRTLPELTFF